MCDNVTPYCCLWNSWQSPIASITFEFSPCNFKHEYLCILCTSSKTLDVTFILDPQTREQYPHLSENLVFSCARCNISWSCLSPLKTSISWPHQNVVSSGECILDLDHIGKVSLYFHSPEPRRFSKTVISPRLIPLTWPNPLPWFFRPVIKRCVFHQPIVSKGATHVFFWGIYVSVHLRVSLHRSVLASAVSLISIIFGNIHLTYNHSRPPWGTRKTNRTQQIPS